MLAYPPDDMPIDSPEPCRCPVCEHRRRLDRERGIFEYRATLSLRDPLAYVERGRLPDSHEFAVRQTEAGVLSRDEARRWWDTPFYGRWARATQSTWEQQDQERRQAEQRAWDALHTRLTPEQRKSLDTSRYFDVRGSEGGWYRISCRTVTYNVFKLHAPSRFTPWRGTTVLPGGYCAGPREDPDTGHVLPDGDFYLAQMLMIRADERAFLAVANHGFQVCL